ncbi:MAG: uracil-DNA glycosylase family protein [Bacteroidota bacterium]
MEALLTEIKHCEICRSFLPQGPRPIVQASASSKILIIGQAPGARVHASGIPWDDVSGDTLRQWLGIDKALFYNPEFLALMPMGFCYPGSGKSGDLPPRAECAPAWHERLLAQMPDIQLTLLIGQYAQNRYLGDKMGENLTETVRVWRNFHPKYLPLPHPSPRNRFWLTKNPWFEEEVLPYLKMETKRIADNNQVT